jgi:TrmH family RNA methyltransferase
MKITPISSAANPLLKRIRSLHERAGREKHGQFILEGAKLLEEAIARNVEVLDIVASTLWLAGQSEAGWKPALQEITVVEDKLFDQLYTTATSCGVIAVATAKQYCLDDCLQGDRTLIAVADAVQDPGNLGTMIRTALAFGATGLIATSGSVDAYHPKVVRSAMGALFALPVMATADIQAVLASLKSSSVRLIALQPRAATKLGEIDMQQALAFVFGNEGNGLSAACRRLVDDLVTIPMPGAMESLNVAISSAIVLYECARRRSCV